ncbi:MAG: hypothetical protein QMD71_09585 [bacterium]|nr:hypothetical protein [bacterium]
MANVKKKVQKRLYKRPKLHSKELEAWTKPDLYSEVLGREVPLGVIIECSGGNCTVDACAN